jgi:osmoprotectant transport system substrate-binding protein
MFRSRSRVFLATFLLVFVTGVLLAACQGAGAKPVRVGSKDFTEEFIVGNMYALILESNGIPVERKLNLGGTPVLQQALVSDQVDIYPEYTGTGLLTVLKLPTNTNREQVFNTVRDQYKAQFNLVWLNPAPMNNTQALAMRREVAQAKGIKTISDMAAQASELTMIVQQVFEHFEYVVRLIFF